ncbi:hypothetical protein [Marinobacter gudaonensis]|nr:hypothetical protein [Marinobacter gudaonensis]
MKHFLLASTVVLSACSEPPPGCDSDFAQMVGEAVSSGEISSVLDMYYMEGVDEFTRDSIKRSFERNFEKTVVGTEIVDFPEDGLTEYEMNGVRYKINLKPEKELIIHFAEETDGEGGIHQSSMSLPLGEYEGHCYIATAAKVSD